MVAFIYYVSVVLLMCWAGGQFEELTTVQQYPGKENESYLEKLVFTETEATTMTAKIPRFQYHHQKQELSESGDVPEKMTDEMRFSVQKIEELEGKTLMKDDKFEFSEIGKGMSLNFKGEKLNKEYSIKEKFETEKKLEQYSYHQTLEERLVVWAHMAEAAQLIQESIYGKQKSNSTDASIDVMDYNLYDDIILRAEDAIEIHNQVEELVAAGYFKKLMKKTKDLDPALIKIQSTGDFVPERVHSKESPEKIVKRVKRKFIRGKKWDVPIYYKFDSGITSSEKNTIRSAIDHWEDKTCIDFVYNDSVVSSHLLFQKVNDDGCGAAYVGRHSGANIVEIDKDCFEVGTVLHEMGHALGFKHEHVRPDRDDYININLHQVPKTKLHNFSIYKPMKTYGVPYDVFSIMHYHSTAFDSVITAKDDQLTPLLGQREGLSFGDVKQANYHYCARACGGRRLKWRSCRNSGYRNPKSCSKCVCPLGWTGRFCHILHTSTSQCGASYRQASSTVQTILSPNYPEKYYGYAKCAWMITSPPYTTIKVWFTGTFQIYMTRRCLKDFVELRYNMDKSIQGPRYCGHTKPNVMLHSKTNSMMVIMQATSGNSPGFSGFRISYSLGYRLSTEQKKWENARTFCKELGGDLVSINTEKEFAAIMIYIQETGINITQECKISGYINSGIWTSGKMKENKNSRWAASNETILDVLWASGQPNDVAHDCVYMLDLHLQLADQSCQKAMCFICEYEHI